MNKVQVNYVKNIEAALKQHLKMGYELRSFEKSAEVELRMNLWHPTLGSVCLARQWWDEMYTETKGDGIGLPEPRVEYRTKSIEEYKCGYMLLKYMGLVDEVESDDLTDVATVRLKESSTLLVHPNGYTWS